MDDWYPHLDPAVKFCQEAAERHQEYGDCYDAWWSDCEEANPLYCAHGKCQERKTWLLLNYEPLSQSRIYLLRSVDQYLNSANKMIRDVLIDDLPTWKRTLQLKQMKFPASDEELLDNDFEQKFENLGIFVANVKQLSSQILTLLQSNVRYIEENKISAYLRQTAGGISSITFNEAIRHAKEQEKHSIHLIETLVSHSLVVTVQPSDPIKQKRNFITEVTLLKSGQFSEDMKSCVHVKVVKVNSENGETEYKETGALLNNMAHLAVQEEKLTAKFSSIKIDSVETRKEGKNAETKAVEKHYALCYQIKNLSCRDIGRMDVHTYSEHFSYMVHSNQSCSAYAMVFWKIALFAERRSGDWNAAEDSEVSWSAFEVSLDYFFRKTIEAEVGLHSNHLKNIGKKLIGHPPTNKDKISYQQVAKQCILELKTTFWEWFYEAMQLIKKEPILQAWKKGWIAGFISKADAEEMLRKAANPSFLFRISDSRFGALSLVVRPGDSEFVHHLAPFDTSSLLTLPLYETIDCDMMNEINFLESYGQSAVPKKTILDILKKGLKQKEIFPDPRSPYLPWSRQFKWDQDQPEMKESGNVFIKIPKLPQMNQNQVNSQSSEVMEVNPSHSFHLFGTLPILPPLPMPISDTHSPPMHVEEQLDGQFGNATQQNDAAFSPVVQNEVPFENRNEYQSQNYADQLIQPLNMQFDLQKNSEGNRQANISAQNLLAYEEMNLATPAPIGAHIQQDMNYSNADNASHCGINTNPFPEETAYFSAPCETDR